MTIVFDNNNETLNLGVTGHRFNRVGKEEIVYPRMIALSIAALKKYPCDRVNTGLALCFDQAMAEAAIALSIPFVAYLPCRDQAAPWTAKQKERYNFLLSKAERVVYAYLGNYAENPDCYTLRDHMIVDESQFMLALCRDSQSGTGKTLRYAVKMKRPYKNLWESWERYKG